jgi:hypothetical protein
VQVNIKNLIDDGQCYQTVRELRWPDGITCPYHGRVLFALAELAASPSGHRTREISALPRFLRVCSQCQKTRESVASRAH